MRRNRTFIEADMPLKGFQEDILSGILHSAGCLGIQETNANYWRVYFDENWSPDGAKNLFQTLKRLNREFDEKNIVISELPFQNWNREWKKYFKPIEPVGGIWIRPPWEKLPIGADGIDIIINPQMGFGTGHHETTALMIKLMKESSFIGRSALDIGTGSGILAILASKLGAEDVVAIDHDWDAIANARHNIELNRINNIKIRCASIESLAESQFPIILANIDYKVLSSLGAKATEILTKKGQLISSGILKEEAHRIESLYKEKGLTLLKKENMNDWTAMLWERRFESARASGQ